MHSVLGLIMSVLARLENVTVHFPIYSLGSRSLKRRVLEISTGGRISQGRNNLVVIEALSHLTLDFCEGDRIAIIGHNGAGKTTLLRILSGVYEPTYGAVSVYGKTAALFDLALCGPILRVWCYASHSPSQFANSQRLSFSMNGFRPWMTSSFRKPKPNLRN